MTITAVPNLTRADAEQRADLLHVSSYQVHLDLTDGIAGPSEQTFRSTTTVAFSSTRPGASTWIDAVAVRIRSAQLNGVALDLTAYSPADGIQLPGLAADNVLVVDADMEYTNTGEGLHRFVDPVGGDTYLYSQFETADAKRVYACFDQPDLKAEFTVSVIAPQSWQVVTNGRELSAEPSGAAKLIRFATTARISTYITALVAGPYHVVEDHHDGIDLRLFCRPELAEHLDADEFLTVTKQGFDWYHANFGVRYPFDKYDQIFVPEFNAGAMENAACVTYREDDIFRSKVTDTRYERRGMKILHEMAHMWFGDLVTMRWWNDLWLNEAFATYAGVLAQANATRWTEAWTTFANNIKSWAYKQDQLPSTHAVATDAPDVLTAEANFDGITYAKGASVLKQLSAYVGEEEFLVGVREYFRTHAFGNTTLEDLLIALEKSSGRELHAWSEVWLETTGISTLIPVYTLDENGAFASFEIVQSVPGDGTDNTLRPHRIAVGLYGGGAGDSELTRTRRVELDVTGSRTPVPDLVGVPRPPLILVNDDDLSYGKIRFDEHSLQTLLDGGVGRLAGSLPRALVWAATWDMTRNAELTARDYLALVLAGAEDESDIGLMQSLVQQAQFAIDHYADPAHAEESSAILADTAIDAARRAAPGSDHQLAWVQTALSAARTPAQLGFARDLLDGTAELDSLAIDPELRWTIIRTLSAHGTIGPDELAAEAERDPSAAGVRHAAAARALQPTAAAKADAWESVVRGEGVANALQEAIVSGFAHPSHGDVLAPYSAAYFDEIPEMWTRRTNELAKRAAAGLFPAWSGAIRQETLDAADAFLAGSHPEPLRRLVAEGRDEVRRALRARALDAERT